MKHNFMIVMVLLALCVQSCAPVGVAAGAGAVVGIGAAKEGGLRNTVSDTAIELKINDLWFKHDVDMFRKTNLTVEDGRVLLTGVVQKPEDRVDAVRLAWQVEGVTQVINEIQVRDSQSFTSIARDTWISAQIRTAITFDKYVQSINYSIDTVQGVVYLFGVGQDQNEVERVIDHARNTSYVTQVVSYVRLRGEIPPNLRTPEKPKEDVLTP